MKPQIVSFLKDNNDQPRHALSIAAVVNYLRNLPRNKDFEVEIREVGKKRSGQQLKAYWVLIALITDYMNEQGNWFSPEEVSSWVKIQANHYHWVGGEKIARSIANKSDATVDDMKKIINFILHFGIEHNIRGCEISNAELDALLRFYESSN